MAHDCGLPDFMVAVVVDAVMINRSYKSEH
jgi:hypothetical protein